MCWKSRKYYKQKIADKDIHVYKICKLIWYGKKWDAIPYYFSEKEKYEIGKTYKADYLDKPEKNGELYTISHGIHSYSCECTIERCIMDNNIKIMSFGDNSVIEWYCTDLRIALMLCTIPKGKIYHSNEDGEYVSEYIRVDDIIPIKQSQIRLNLNRKIKKWNNE